MVYKTLDSVPQKHRITIVFSDGEVRHAYFKVKSEALRYAKNRYNRIYNRYDRYSNTYKDIPQVYYNQLW